MHFLKKTDFMPQVHKHTTLTTLFTFSLRLQEIHFKLKGQRFFYQFTCASLIGMKPYPWNMHLCSECLLYTISKLWLYLIMYIVFALFELKIVKSCKVIKSFFVFYPYAVMPDYSRLSYIIRGSDLTSTTSHWFSTHLIG
jgi:hypothetical protein